MRLGDFFVGSRQLFGFIAPGTVWIISVIVALANITPLIFLQSLTGAEVFLLLAAALVVGTAIETISFRFAVTVSARLHGAKVSRERGDLDYFPSDVDPELLSDAKEHLHDEGLVGPYFQRMTNREVSQLCRRFVLERSSYFKNRVIEYEAEINLMAMFVLPLLFFAVCWTLTVLIAPAPADGSSPLLLLWAMWFVPVCATASLFLYRIHPLRKEEAEAWFQMFLELRTISKEVPGLGA